MSSIEDANIAGKEAVDGAMRSFSAVTKGLQQIATETTEYTKRSYEQSARMFEQLSQSRSLDKVLEVQNEYAKAAYNEWVSQATRLGELYSSIAKEAAKPFETSIQRASGFGEAALRQAN